MLGLKLARRTIHPHHLGSRGYKKKGGEWERQEAELINRGVTPETVDWEWRSVNFLLARGASYKPDGSLSVGTSSSLEDLTRKVAVAHVQSSQGSLLPSSREKDVLTHALGTKEHPGRTRGKGVVPWKIGFEEDEATHQAWKQAEEERKMKEMEERVLSRLQEQLTQLQAAAIGSRAVDPPPTHMSPAFKGSSCGCTSMQESEANIPHPVDNINERTPYKLYVPQQWCSLKVAIGQVWTLEEGMYVPRRWILFMYLHHRFM